MRAAVMFNNYGLRSLGNEVFPEKVEEPFLDLMKHLKELRDALNGVRYYKVSATEVSRTIEKMQVEPSVQEDLLKQIIELASQGTMTVKSAEDLLKLAQENMKLVYQQERAKIQQGKMDELDSKSVESQKAVQMAIKHIAEDLQRIAALDNVENLSEDQRRLDGIRVSKRHLKKIATTKLSDEGKAILLRALETYSELNVLIFKRLEDFAKEILVKDKEGTLSLNDLDPEYISSKYNWLVAGFNDFEDGMGYTLQRIERGIMPQEIFEKFLTVMQEYISFLKTGTFDRDLVSSILDAPEMFDYYPRVINVMTKMVNFGNSKYYTSPEVEGPKK